MKSGGSLRIILTQVTEDRPKLSIHGPAMIAHLTSKTGLILFCLASVALGSSLLFAQIVYSGIVFDLYFLQLLSLIHI